MAEKSRSKLLSVMSLCFILSFVFAVLFRVLGENLNINSDLFNKEFMFYRLNYIIPLKTFVLELVIKNHGYISQQQQSETWHRYESSWEAKIDTAPFS